MEGQPLRVHLENWERQNCRPHPTLSDAPTLPVGLDAMWRDFMSLHGSRGSSGFGPSRLTYSDIDAYQRVQGMRLPAWQVEAIRRADGAYLAQYAETHKPKGAK